MFSPGTVFFCYLLDNFSGPLDHDGLCFFDRRGHLIVVAQQTQDGVLVPVPAGEDEEQLQVGSSRFEMQSATRRRFLTSW